MNLDHSAIGLIRIINNVNAAFSWNIITTDKSDGKS